MSRENGLFLSDVLLPERYRATRGVKVPIRGEEGLVAAVLQEAIGNYQNYIASREQNGRQIFWEAADWFASDDRVWPYAFLNICDALHIDAQHFRQGLEVWRQQRGLPFPPRPIKTGRQGKLSQVSGGHHEP